MTIYTTHRTNVILKSMDKVFLPYDNLLHSFRVYLKVT